MNIAKWIYSLIVYIIIFNICMITHLAYGEGQNEDLNGTVALFIHKPDAYLHGYLARIDNQNENVCPIIIDGRTLVPIRFIAESLEAGVSWNDETSTATISQGSNEIRLRVDSTSYYINEEKFSMEVAPRLLHDRVFIPLRVVAEALEKELIWDDRGLIIISDKTVISQNVIEMLISEVFAYSGVILKEFFVSADGSDTNSGSMQAPFASIEKAKEEVRKINKNMKGDIIINIREGEYVLDKTFTLGENDGGCNGYKVVYRAFQGEKVTMSGAKKITGFTEEVIDGKTLWKAKAPVDFMRQLYVNHERRENALSDKMYSATKISEDQKGFEVPCDIYPKDADMSGMEIYYPCEDWTSRILLADQITTVDDKTCRISTKSPTYDFAIKPPVSPAIHVASKFYLKNALFLVNREGEWYFHPNTKEVYYLPKAEEKMDTTIFHAPLLENLLKIDGSSHIEISGITFMGASWNNPSIDGFYPNQAQDIRFSSQENKMIPSAISVSHSKKLTFFRNTFTNLGACAIGIYEHVQNSNIIGNSFYHLSDGAIIIGRVNQRNVTIQEGLCDNIKISNNFITDVAKDYPSSPAITSYFASNLDISNNEICSVPYSAISIGWNWTNKIVTARDLKVKNNYIQDCMKVTKDGGGIYTLGQMPNAVIEGNYIDGVLDVYSGIYLDQGTALAEVKNNVVLDAPTAYFYKNNELIIKDNYSDTKEIKVGLQPEKDDPTIQLSNARIEPPKDSKLFPNEVDKIKNKSGLQAAYKDLKNGFTEEAPRINIKDQFVTKAFRPLSLGAEVFWGNEAVADPEIIWQVVSAPQAAMITIPGCNTQICKGMINVDYEATDDAQVVFSIEGEYVIKPKIGGKLVDKEVHVSVLNDDSNVTNVALHKKAISNTSWSEAYTAEKIVDGNIGTEWASKNQPNVFDYVIIDLEKAYQIKRIDVVMRQNVDNSVTRKSFDIQVSNTEDFKSYVLVGRQGLEPLPFASTWSRTFGGDEAYRYVRIITNKPNSHKALAELSVFAQK